MTIRMVEYLQEELHKRRSLIEGMSDRAMDEGRDLTDEEMQTITSMQEEIAHYRGRLDQLTVDLEIADTTKARLATLGTAVATSGFNYRSAGDLLWDCLHQSDADARARYTRVMRRVAEHMGTEAANTTAVAGDLGGLVVRPVVGPVVNPYPSGMPFATAIGMRDIPASDGFGFTRPYLVDPGFGDGVGVQALEKAELASRAFSVEATNVPLQTVGGYLNVSQQLQSFNPSALQIILDQMRRRLENYVDGRMVGEAMQTTTSVVIPAAPTAAQLIQAIYQAAALYYQVTYQLPTWIAMGPLGWAMLGGTTDAAGRPLFPTLGAANAPGSMEATSFAVTVAGLRPVVTPNIATTDFYVGGPDALEGYMYRFPVLEAVEPSVLGRQIAVAASVAPFRPAPFANAIVRIGV